MAPRILVVDPERDVRDLIVSGLTAQGYELLAASTGVECLAIAQSEHLDLICTEVALPGIDGFKAAERLQEDSVTQHVPIVFLTTRTSLTDRVKGLRLGAHAYLTKPFAFPELYAVIDGIIRRAQRQTVPMPTAGLTGSLAAVGIAGVIQAIEAEAQSGVLSVASETKWGRVCFSQGKVVEATTGSGSGDQAVYEMLSWNSGSYAFRAQSVDQQAALAENATSLLMRAFQRYDEDRSAARSDEGTVARM